MNIQTAGQVWQQWQLHRSITPRNLLIALLVFVLLSISAHNTEMDQAFVQTSEALLSAVGIGESQVLDGAIRFGGQAFPLVISQRTPINRLDEFDRDNLPLFAYIEVAEDRDYDALTNTWEVETTEFLVEPIGYLVKVS
jgi:phosphonate transport system permease protein